MTIPSQPDPSNAMCHERERLIDYLYGECARDDRARVDAHLHECSGCREELASLQEVRQDLLAWDVPAHQPVWRAFAPKPVVPSWRDVPAWMFATAAGLMLLAGATGGLAARWLWPTAPAGALIQVTDSRLAPVPTAAPGGALSAPVPVAVNGGTVTLTAADLQAFESRLLQQVRAEWETRQAPASTAGFSQVRSAGDARAGGAPDVQSLLSRVADIEAWRDDQISLNVELDSKLGRLSTRTSNLNQLYELSRYQRVGNFSMEPGR